MRRRNETVTIGDCITVAEIDGEIAERDVTVRLALHPAEPCIMYGRDGGGYPGADAEAEVISATYDDGSAVPQALVEASETDWQERAFEVAGERDEAAADARRDRRRGL